MKTLRYLILLLAIPCSAQSIIGTEFANTFDFPAGTYTLQYGCANNWTTKTFTYTKATSGVGFIASNFGLTGDPRACIGQPQIQILPNAASFNVGIHTFTNGAYSGAVAKTITALTPAPVPAPTPVTSVPMGATGSCTWTLTIDATGNPLLTIK